ncbi:MAG: glycosyltransferase family 2 protein [Actinobacteria bacterium]|nr:glycosyltransferase family 2 protein [Actinomycetota bacterium]
MRRPSVTILLPVLDEEDHIGLVLDDLAAQDYQGEIEVIVADGMSTDRTREIVLDRATRDRRLRLIDNPGRSQAHGLNAAASVAAGEVLIRADGHTRYASNYVSTSVTALEETGGAVGGRMNPVGSNGFGRAVAAAMNHPLTMGPARFHHATSREPVDTVYLGAFHKRDFQAVGGIRSFPSGSSEDADFYYRWRLSGRRVYVDPEIVTLYTPRRTVRALWRQYWRYGQGKSEMLWANGRLPSWRPLVPMALVLALAAGFVVGSTGSWLPLVVVIALWLALLVVVALSGRPPTPLVIVAGGVMHLAYGLGAIWGLVRGPRGVRDGG